MANDFSAVVPYLSILGLGVFRDFAVMPRLINSNFGEEAAEKGDTINVNIAPPVTVTDVTPSATPYAAPDVTATKVPITLDTWKQAAFKMTDKDMMEAANGILPTTAKNAAIALAEFVNTDLLSLYNEVVSFGGTPGTTPFAGSPKTTVDAVQARKRLNVNKAPLAERRLVLDPDAMANALEIPGFQDASASADPNIVTEGHIGRKIGFNWFEEQSVVTHTAGVLTSTGSTPVLTVTGVNAIGVTSLGVTVTDLGESVGYVLKQGDKLTIAGDSTVYHVTADVTLAPAASPATGTIVISPGLVVATEAADVVTLKTDYVANLAFNREAIAFANRPLAISATPSANSNIRVEVDPLTGISMRLEIVRQHGQDLFRYDILYGKKVVYPDLVTIIAG